MAGNNGEDGQSDGNKITDLADRRSRARAQQISSPVAVRLAKARTVLPQNCPIEPVGFDGDTYYVIDCKRQLRAMRPRDLGRQMVFSLAGDRLWLASAYPRMRNGKPVLGFATETAAEDLMHACHLMGYWSPDQQIRGRGAWRGEDGDLILHRGDHLVIRGRRVEVGRHGEFVYPLRPALAPLAPQPQREGADSAAAELLARLDTFMWSRGTLDSYLMLGWICAALVGGALDFRPHSFVTGEFQVGKSTLQLLLQLCFGLTGIVSVSNTSAAGLWQAFQCDTLPAGVDELEAEEDQTKQRELIKLIRQASSGGRILRGDVHHHGAEFLIRSCFCCSAILIPPMPSQDLSRFHVFNLMPPPPGTPMRPFNTERLAQIGAGVLRRVVDHFPRMVSDVVPLFRAHLQQRGFPRRSADLYAALFGAAEIALYDETSTKRLDKWCDNHFMQEILADVLEDQTPEWQRCLAYLRSTPIDYRRPDGPAIGELLAVAVNGMRKASQGQIMQGNLLDMNGQELTGGDDDGRIATARDKLLSVGLRIGAQPAGFGEPPELALIVANAHQGLAQIFRGTPWQTSANAAGGGGWWQALRRMPGARPSPRALRFREGVQSRALILPMEALFPEAPQPDDSNAERATEDRPRAAPLH